MLYVMQKQAMRNARQCDAAVITRVIRTELKQSIIGLDTAAAIRFARYICDDNIAQSTP